MLKVSAVTVTWNSREAIGGCLESLLNDGSVGEIKSRFGKNTILLEFDGELKDIKGVKNINHSGNYAELLLEPGADTQDVLKTIASKVRVSRFELSAPSLNEIFIQVVEEA